MTPENARTMARNVYAKYAGITRREAARLLEKVADETCFALAEATPEQAEKIVTQAELTAAQQIVNEAAKRPGAQSQDLNTDGAAEEKRAAGTEEGAESGAEDLIG